MDRERSAWIFAGATVALWSTVATAFELGLRDLSPAALLAGANVVAVLVLALLAAGLGRLGALRGLTGADHRRALLLGALNPALYYLVLFEAYDRLPGQVAQPGQPRSPVEPCLSASGGHAGKARGALRSHRYVSDE